MQGINDFIVQVKNAYNETIKVGKADIYLDKKMSSLRASNRIAKVVALPLKGETSIEEGYEVVIDPTILFCGVIHEAERDSPYLVDKEKGWYRLPKDLLVLYRKDDGPWQTSDDLLLVEPIAKEEKLTSSLLELVSFDKKVDQSKARVAYSNKTFTAQGVKVDDTVAITPGLCISYWLEDKEYWCVHKRNILALVA